VNFRRLSRQPAYLLLEPGQVVCARAGHAFRTVRLLVRTRLGTDLDGLRETANDAETVRWQGYTPELLRVLEVSWSVPVRVQKLVSEQLTVVDMATGAVAGDVLLRLTTGGQGILGFNVHPAFRHRGVGAEVVTAALAFAHHHLGVQQIVSGTSADNAAAGRVIRRAGMTWVWSEPTKLPNGEIVPGDWYLHSDTSTQAGCCVRWGTPQR
jgi:RimJ/RimL family protein N-acetyltransferase